MSKSKRVQRFCRCHMNACPLNRGGAEQGISRHTAICSCQSHLCSLLRLTGKGRCSPLTLHLAVIQILSVHSSFFGPRFTKDQYLGTSDTIFSTFSLMQKSAATGREGNLKGGIWYSCRILSSLPLLLCFRDRS